MTNLNLSVLTTKQNRTDYLFEPASHTQRGGAFDLHKLIGKLPTPKSGWTYQIISIVDLIIRYKINLMKAVTPYPIKNLTTKLMLFV